MRAWHSARILRRRRHRWRRQRGFTLVEILVALAILAGAMSVVLTLIANGLRQTKDADLTATTELRAQSLLARLGADLPLRVGQTDGEFPDHVRWRMQVAPFGDASDQEQWPLSAYLVSIEVRREAGLRNDVARLATIRLGPKEPAR